MKTIQLEELLNKEKYSKDDFKLLVRIAYKKLKSYNYYQKQEFYLRKKISDYEKDSNFEKKLDKLADEIEMSIHDDTEIRTSKIKYDLQIFPKKFEDCVKDADVISNIDVGNAKIEQVTYMIDLDVETQIIGVLWIMLSGYKLENKYKNYVYSGILDHSWQNSQILLYKPFFNQYKKWQSKAIDEANRLLDSGKDVILVTLDIKNYYYSVDIDFKKLNEDLDLEHCEDNDRSCLEKKLTNVIEKVITTYKVENDSNIIPIGFMPSIILGNWYLKDIDKELNKQSGVSFYGRYVDDILIVLNNRVDEDFSKQKILEKYFSEVIDCNKEMGKECYKINKLKSCYIKNEKISIYKLFANGTRKLLEKFERGIQKNSSIFNFLPEQKELIEDLDEKIVDLNYSNNLSKIRDIDGFKLNKNELSKYLTRSIHVNKFNELEKIKITDEQILMFFSGTNSVDLFMMWEKLFLYFKCSDNKKMYIKMVTLIIQQLLKLKYDRKKTIKYNFSKEGIINKGCYNDITKKFKLSRVKMVELLYDSLKQHLVNSIALVESLGDFLLNSDDKNEKIVDAFNMKNPDEKKIASEIVNDVRNVVDSLRKANMIRHEHVVDTMINYTNKMIKLNSKKESIAGGMCKDDYNSSSNFKCLSKNEYYLKINQSEKIKCSKCDYMLHERFKLYSPRWINLHECVIYQINKNIAKCSVLTGVDYLNEAKKMYNKINFELTGKGISKKLNSTENFEKKELNFKVFEKEKVEDYRKTKKFDPNDYLFSQKESSINILEVGKKKIKKVKVALCHMKINDEDLEKSFRKKTNFSRQRLDNLFTLINKAAKLNADILIIPEVALPIEWLEIITNFSRSHQMAIICGLEHVIYEDGKACNYIAQILPFEDKYKHAIVKLRLKNHYSPRERKVVSGYSRKDPSFNSLGNQLIGQLCKKEYDLVCWNDIYFSVYSCFELANIKDRALFMSYVDILIGVVHNKDINYYSNIIESLSRDIHCYFIQVNNSEYGDSRVTQPTKTNSKNIIQLKGGQNDLVVIGEIDIKKLREFQIKFGELQADDLSFKATPPEFNNRNVAIREGDSI